MVRIENQKVIMHEWVEIWYNKIYLNDCASDAGTSYKFHWDTKVKHTLGECIELGYALNLSGLRCRFKEWSTSRDFMLNTIDS
jgi:hypothetical protein